MLQNSSYQLMWGVHYSLVLMWGVQNSLVLMWGVQNSLVLMWGVQYSLVWNHTSRVIHLEETMDQFILSV